MSKTLLVLDAKQRETLLMVLDAAVGVLRDDALREIRATLTTPAVSEELFYILDSRSVVGNCASWWCPEGHGYTCELAKAGLFGREDAFSHRETDVPIPSSLVHRMVVTHVRLDLLRDEIDIREYQKIRTTGDRVTCDREKWWAKQQKQIAEKRGDRG